MKQDKKIKNYILYILLIIYIILYLILFRPKYLKYAESINASFLILILSLSILFYGFRRIINTDLSKKINKRITTIVIIYLIIIYGLGLIKGFLSNSYSLEFTKIIDNIFPVIISIISTEIIRYNFIKSNKNNKIDIYLITILLSFIETLNYIKFDSFVSIESTFKFATLTLLPIGIKNIMCSYFDYYIDFRCALIYRLILDLYIYLVPIVPDFSNLFNSILDLFLPFFIIMNISRYIYNYTNVSSEENKKWIKASDAPIIIILILLIFLNFGIGPYKIIGIRSDSMNPKIKKGDAVIINKNIDKNKLKEKDIVAYKRGNDIIVHRIISVNRDNSFTTKGDFNNTADEKYVKKNQIIGKVNMRIPLIAYPAVYFER